MAAGDMGLFRSGIQSECETLKIIIIKLAVPEHVHIYLHINNFIAPRC